MRDEPGDLEQRLRSALTLDFETLPGGDGIEMTAEAITRRILDLAELSSLCLALATAGGHDEQNTDRITRDRDPPSP